MNPRNEKEWEMLLNPNLGHFGAYEGEAEQIRPAHGRPERLPALTASSHSTSSSASRGKQCALLLLNSAAAGSVLHNGMTAQFANLSVELTSRPSRRQIRKAADKKKIIGSRRPELLSRRFSEVTAARRRPRNHLRPTSSALRRRSRQQAEATEEIFLSSTFSQTINSRGCVIFGAKPAFMQYLGIWNSDGR